MSNDHYLKKELFDLIQSDPEIFKFIQFGSLDGIWYWNLENQEDEWIGPKFWEILGYDPSKKKHKASEWQDIINKDDLKLALSNFKKHYEDKNHPYDQVVRYTHKNGSTVWVRCRGLIIRDNTGKPIRMLGAHNELTALKQTEIELTKSNQELQRFARVVAHDLKQPLRLISNFTKLLKDELPPGTLEKNQDLKLYSNMIISNSEQMTKFIDELLNYSKTHNSLDTTLVQTDLKEVTNIAIQNCLALHADDIIKINQKFENIPIILGNKTLLIQVFQNLLNNSIKFKSSKRQLQIKISYEEKKNNEILISFKDNGNGFNNPNIDYFEIFSKGKQYNNQQKGYGMGLALCAKIIKIHHGNIWIDFSHKNGAKINFSLKKYHI